MSAALSPSTGPCAPPQRRLDALASCGGEKCRLGLPAIWLQDGVVDHAAALRAQAAGMTVVMDRCVYRDYHGCAGARR